MPRKLKNLIQAQLTIKVGKKVMKITDGQVRKKFGLNNGFGDKARR